MEKKVHICTVGWESADRIVKSMLGFSPPSKVYLIYGKQGGMDHKGKAETIAGEVKSMLEETYMPIPIEFKELDNPHDPNEIWYILQEVVEKETKDGVEICLNVSAGTKVMVVASIMFTVLREDANICIYYGVPQSYPISDEEDKYTSVGCKEVVEIPRLTPSLKRLFMSSDKTASKILGLLDKKRYNSIKELTEEIDVPRSTIKYYLDMLEQQKFVKLTREGKESKIEITKMGRTYSKILGKK
jgi:DNA-binding transcriptional ArsR family regulator